MSVGIVQLSTAQAQARFEQLPLDLQISSLSPAFAAADARRDPRLRCIHAALDGGAAVWLHSVHLLPLGGGDALGAISPYGYGGPLTDSTCADTLASAWADWKNWCREEGVLAEFCRFHPHAQGHRAFLGSVRENRQTVSIDLTVSDVEISFNSLTRRKLARARKAGVISLWSDTAADWQRYATFYRGAMQAIGASAFHIFPDAYFAALRTVPGAQLLICQRDGRWLSGGVYLQGGRVMEYHLGASTLEGKELGTACLLQAEAAAHGRAAGFHELYLGGGTDTTPDNSLLFYKLGFSRRTLTYRIGESIHDDNRYWAAMARMGFTPSNPPSRLLLN